MDAEDDPVFDLRPTLCPSFGVDIFDAVDVVLALTDGVQCNHEDEENAGQGTRETVATIRASSQRSARVERFGVRFMAGMLSKKSANGTEASDGLSASERIDGVIAGLGDWRGERLADIRMLIREADAEVVEEWKWMVSPVFSHDGIFVVANRAQGEGEVDVCAWGAAR